MDYVTPLGFHDVLPAEATRRESIQRKVQERFAACGYQPLETPTLEVMGVMQAGGHVPGTPFKFFDSQGDLLAMRPDVTLQIARMAAMRLGNQPGPFRFRYNHRVFREASSDLQASARELTQIGVECIGAEGVEADAEVVGLLAEALELAGVTDYRLALATVSVLNSLLEASGAPQWWQRMVLEAFHSSDFIQLNCLTSEDDLPQVMAEANIAAPPANAAAVCPPVYAQALREIPRIRGGRDAIQKVRNLVEPLGCAEGLDDFEATFDKLCGMGLGEKLLVDFSVMSSFDYYTGIVFEAYSPNLGTPLGSGGRYDKLIGSYGKDRPAAGCAFYLESVMQAADRTEDPAARPLRIAVPKGSLNEGAIKVLAQAGLDTTGLENPGRALIIHNPGVDYIIVRPTDAPAFVAHGAADCGICGRDSILEADPDVVQLVDLRFGGCRFIVAEPEGARSATESHYERLGSIRVATKYPRITRAHYAKSGTQVEVVKLHGNIELAPLTGMAERIVDITATGTTLRENNLVIVEDVIASTARFFANTCAFRTDPRIEKLAQTLKENVAKE
ncbi:MAG: ATP phosphoribosyltransferase [Coriobacteriia bacterium]|nr:ATP phosphoribosyltransferase [Coriobacteriia bacterium]